jgi:DNA-binding response OmpR family regulator
MGADAATANLPVIVLSRLTEKNRQKLIAAGAEDYVEKNSLMPMPGVNVLSKILENLTCRIKRKREVAFSDVPLHDQSKTRVRLMRRVPRKARGVKKFLL